METRGRKSEKMGYEDWIFVFALALLVIFIGGLISVSQLTINRIKAAQSEELKRRDNLMVKFLALFLEERIVSQEKVLL